MKSEEDRIKALSQVSVAISSSFDIRTSLALLLEKLIQQLEVDAAAVFTLDIPTARLNLVVGNGFQTTQDELAVLGADDQWAGRVVLERKLITLPDLKEIKSESAHTVLMGREGFTGYCGVPLITKGNVVGVLEFFSRTPLPDDSRWQEFLQLMGGQAAIAIDIARLFENLQRTNVELTKAYDATMEGWAHALELRDMETGGKSRRVTELSLMFARRLGISGEGLINLQRGALLHGIGKMGVPDAVLRKPAPLNEAETKMLRQEPMYAYQLLLPIAYLHSAADVPYCMHENWDGSGYPRGLKGEDIPLAARIVAIVAAWDDLVSDHPYRSALAMDQARQAIRDQAGSRFDPKLVEEFLKLVDR